MHQIYKRLTIPESHVRIATIRRHAGRGSSVIRLLALITLAILLFRETAYATGQQRQLDFYHTHTGESLTIVYHDGKDYIPAALEQVNHFMGDFRSGDVHAIAPATLDILYRLRTELGVEDTFEVISGYRSPKTNSMLRKQGRGVARRSQHMEGTAIDIRLRGVETVRLRDAAIKLQLGGVGYYRESDFVHVDSARVRTW